MNTQETEEAKGTEGQTPAQRELAVLNEVWEVLKKHGLAFDGGIRMAVRLIYNLAEKSGDRQRAFEYASKLLTRTMMRAMASAGVAAMAEAVAAEAAMGGNEIPPSEGKGGSKS
jgi:hypothetical protein